MGTSRAGTQRTRTALLTVACLCACEDVRDFRRSGQSVSGDGGGLVGSSVGTDSDHSRASNEGPDDTSKGPGVGTSSGGSESQLDRSSSVGTGTQSDEPEPQMTVDASVTSPPTEEPETSSAVSSTTTSPWGSTEAEGTTTSSNVPTTETTANDPTTSEPAPPRKLVFMDPGPYLANFAAGYGEKDMAAHLRGDELCQKAAETAGKTGVFRAWLSTTEVLARKHFRDNGLDGPWYREDGELVASNLDALIAGNGLVAPIFFGPDGYPAFRAWTGTDQYGAALLNCDNFTDNTTGSAYCSYADEGSETWSHTINIACTSPGEGLLCFEQ